MIANKISGFLYAKQVLKLKNAIEEVAKFSRDKMIIEVFKKNLGPADEKKFNLGAIEVKLKELQKDAKATSSSDA